MGDRASNFIVSMFIMVVIFGFVLAVKTLFFGNAKK